MLEITSPLLLAGEVSSLYSDGLHPGDSTGWASVDPFFTVQTGFWTVITGIPSHGKSTWLDCLMIHLMKHGWKFIVYSPENQPTQLYLAQLAEKALKRPFREGYANRMEPTDIARVMAWLDTNMRILRMAADSRVVPDIHAILFACEEIIQHDFGEAKIGIVIDPWNEMDHTPLGGLNETQWTNSELMQFRHWIRNHNAHGFIVAHPQKPQRDKDGNYRRITMYDINGSAAWYNKCDHGIIVRRLEDGRTEIDIEKCRFRHLGGRGTAILRYNSGTQTYADEVTIGGGRYREA